MPEAIPNLAGVATKGLVESIGSGSYKADYINWSRTMNLLRDYAPGWMAEAVPTTDGALVHPSSGPGGYLLIRFRHVDGTVTPSVPQAVMDHKNKAIALDNITARDITDTHRRGCCLAAAFTFGLAYELWAKMPLEAAAPPIPSDDLPADTQPATRPTRRAAASASATPAPAASAESQAAPTTEQPPADEAISDKQRFMEAAIEKGLTTHAIESLISRIGSDFLGGIEKLREKDAAWVRSYNEASDPANDAKKF